MNSLSIPDTDQDGNTRLIPLTQGRSAVVDAGDYDWLMQWKWCFLVARRREGDRGYAVRRPMTGKGTQTTLYMHRVITNVVRELQVDHINHDTTDNRRCNLRIVTAAQNSYNRHPRSSGPSEFKGVRKLKSGWMPVITHNGQPIYLGLFANELDAARAYDQAARSLFGEYAYLNFPGEVN